MCILNIEQIHSMSESTRLLEKQLLGLLEQKEGKRKTFYLLKSILYLCKMYSGRI